MPVMAESAWAYLFIGLLAGERVLEVCIARRNERRLRKKGAKEFGRAFSRFLFLFHASWLLAFAAEAVLTLSRPLIAPAGAFVVMALLQALRYWCILSLGPFWNTKVIVQPGAPIVRKGPYRWLKHPNYLVVRIEIAFYPLFWGCWITGIFFGLANLLILHRRIRQEEQALQLVKPA